MQLLDLRAQIPVVDFGGTGPIILFSHANGYPPRVYRDLLTRLTREYRVLGVEHRPLWQDDPAQLDSWQRFAEDVAELLDELGEPVHGLGHSMGGYVGYSFVEQFGEKLQGLCIFHSHPFGDTPKKKVDRDRGIKFIKRYGSEKYVTSMLLALFSFDHGERFKMIVQKLILKACKYSEEAIINGLVAMKNRKNSATILVQINCPVQFIIGKKDVAISWDDSLKQTSLPNIANIRIFEKVGHMGMFEAKEQTQQAILEFILKCKAFGIRK